VFGQYLYVSTYNPDQGGQVWRFNGTDWQQVVSGGLTTRNNAGLRNLVIFNGAIYGGTRNTSNGAELWRSFDGENWEAIVRGGWGNRQNVSVRGMAVFKDHLYVGLQNTRGGPGQLWRSLDGVNFEAVSRNAFGNLNNDSIHVLLEFGGLLYAGTRNIEDGLEIWRSEDGMNFEPVVGPAPAIASNGFNNSANIQCYDLKEFKGSMYVGLANLNGYRVFRTEDGVNYEEVLRSSNRWDAWSWKFGVYEDHLWLGTFNILGMYIRRLVRGGSLLRTIDGEYWETMIGENGLYQGAGFNDKANWGIRSFELFQPPGAPRPFLYIGTASCWNDCGGNGAEVWEWQGEVCQE
jgi:hypothetical protein